MTRTNSENIRTHLNGVKPNSTPDNVLLKEQQTIWDFANTEKRKGMGVVGIKDWGDSARGIKWQDWLKYHNVTTSLEYVFVGTDFALARPVKWHKYTVWWHRTGPSHWKRIDSTLERFLNDCRRVARNNQGLIDLRLSSHTTCWNRSTLMRKVTVVTRKNPQVRSRTTETQGWLTTTRPAWSPKEYSTGVFLEGHPSSNQPCSTGLNFGQKTVWAGQQPNDTNLELSSAFARKIWRRRR